MTAVSADTLELRALQQRNRIHETAAELRAKVVATRKKLDITANAREHFVGGSILGILFGLASGYGVGGLFSQH
jgi:hypothetical protein